MNLTKQKYNEAVLYIINVNKILINFIVIRRIRVFEKLILIY